jgi:alkylation response protein AidB-like acyl-CoA dehydrogenase
MPSKAHERSSNAASRAGVLDELGALPSRREIWGRGRIPMNLALTEEETQLQSALRSLFARESSPDRVRSAEETGFDPDLWRQLQAMGIPAMAVADGTDAAASFFQLLLVAEEVGRALASAPIIETCVVNRLLARCGPAGQGLLEATRDGGTIATLALHGPIEGTARMVPAGAIAQVVVALEGHTLVAFTSDPPQRSVHNLGSLPLAHRELGSSSKVVLAEGRDALREHAQACSEWKALTSGQMVGLASAALSIGVEYVKSRTAFGAPLATYQTIAHRLADNATALSGAQLLAYEAAWAHDTQSSRAVALTSMSWCFATEVAMNVSRDSLHYHGGYGFTKEYDIQLYFRRAKAYSLVWGDPRREYLRLADALFSVDEAGAA